MILTVTPNTALDHVLFLSRLVPNARNQATEGVVAMGGKGCNVAQALVELGEEAVAIGLAAGDTGRRMEAMLHDRGVRTDFVWTDGQTRVNAVIIESETGAHTTICEPGLRPREEDLAQLLALIERHGSSARAIALCGSLPEGWPASHYAAIAATARATGVPVVVDCSGENLTPALRGGAAAVKPNQAELAATVDGSIDSVEDVVGAARTLLARGAARVLVSMGAAGAVAVSPEGAWQCDAPPVTVCNPAGAGDGMTACLALGLANGDPLPAILRRAVAVGSAIATTTATGDFRRSEADCLFNQIEVREWRA